MLCTATAASASWMRFLPRGLAQASTVCSCRLFASSSWPGVAKVQCAASTLCPSLRPCGPRLYRCILFEIDGSQVSPPLLWLCSHRSKYPAVPLGAPHFCRSSSGRMLISAANMKSRQLLLRYGEERAREGGPDRRKPPSNTQSGCLRCCASAAQY